MEHTIAIWWLIALLAVLLVAVCAFLWVAFKLHEIAGTKVQQTRSAEQERASYEARAKEEVEHIFNDEFRQELRNSGRLHFQKALNENAMFLEQDLRLTISQLNDYLKTEVMKRLQEDFREYEKTMNDARVLAVEAIQKTTLSVEEQRKTLSEAMEKDVEARKDRVLQLFEDRMAEVVNHYLLEAVGSQVDLSDQMDYILAELERNREAIVEDIRL